MSLNSRKLSKGSPSYSNNISNIASKDCSFVMTKLDKDGKKTGLGAATIVEADHIEEVKSSTSKNGSNREVSTKIDDLPDLSLVDGLCSKKKSSTDMMLPTSLLLINNSGRFSPVSRNINSQEKIISNSFKASPKTANFSLQIKPKLESKSNKSLLNKLEVGKFMTRFKSGVSKTIGLILDRTDKDSMIKSSMIANTIEENPLEIFSMRESPDQETNHPHTTKVFQAIDGTCEHRRVNSDNYKFPARTKQIISQQEDSGMNSARLIQQPIPIPFQPFKTFDGKTLGDDSSNLKSLKKTRKSNFKSDESIKEFKKSYTTGGTKRPPTKKTAVFHDLEKEVKGLKKQNNQLKAENETIKKVGRLDLDPW